MAVGILIRLLVELVFALGMAVTVATFFMLVVTVALFGLPRTLGFTRIEGFRFGANACTGFMVITAGVVVAFAGDGGAGAQGNGEEADQEVGLPGLLPFRVVMEGAARWPDWTLRS
ncbi:MAG: hypothetical protein ABEK42_03445 [Thiohalorhabdaceae bacterium]